MHAHPGDPISLNLPLLQSRFPDLAALARKRLTLDEIGETLALRSRQSSPTVRVMGFVQRKPDYSPESEWLGVKREICDLLSGTDAESAGFHRLLRDGSSSATLRILSALSLRIAGTLGISVKRTTPLVAVALHDMARHGAQAWCGEIPA